MAIIIFLPNPYFINPIWIPIFYPIAIFLIPIIPIPNGY